MWNRASIIIGIPVPGDALATPPVDSFQFIQPIDLDSECILAYIHVYDSARLQPVELGGCAMAQAGSCQYLAPSGLIILWWVGK